MKLCTHFAGNHLFYAEALEDMIVLSGQETTPQIFLDDQNMSLEKIVTSRVIKLPTRHRSHMSSIKKKSNPYELPFRRAMSERVMEIQKSYSQEQIILNNKVDLSHQRFSRSATHSLRLLTAPNAKKGHAFTLLLDLCRLLDRAYEEPQTGGPMYRQFQQQVCQLQVIDIDSIPSDNKNEELAFGLNLYNLMVRHALLEYVSKHQPWPIRYSEMKYLFSHLYYNVAGSLITVQELQDSLLEIYKQDTRKRTNIFSGRRERRKVKQITCSILCSMTLGTRDSPEVTLIEDAATLPQILDRNAKRFCQRYIQVRSNYKLILPRYVKWFPDYFGSTPQQVLKRLQPFLSSQQLLGLNEIPIQKREVIFLAHDWEPLYAFRRTLQDFHHNAKDSLDNDSEEGDNSIHLSDLGGDDIPPPPPPPPPRQHGHGIPKHIATVKSPKRIMHSPVRVDGQASLSGSLWQMVATVIPFNMLGGDEEHEPTSDMDSESGSGGDDDDDIPSFYGSVTSQLPPGGRPVLRRRLPSLDTISIITNGSA